MGNKFSGVAGDRNNKCSYCATGRFLGWNTKGMIHTHDENIPWMFKRVYTIDQQAGLDDLNLNEKQISTAQRFCEEHIRDEEYRNRHLTFLGDDINVNQFQLESANKAVIEFCKDSIFDPKKEFSFDFVIALAKIQNYRIFQPLRVSDDVNLMIRYAKNGDFDNALKLMTKYPCIVNYIPANRAWGLIHQAAYFNNYEAMKTILNNPKCDPSLRTKRAMDGIVPAGSTADVIAMDEMVKNLILERQVIKKKELLARTPETIVTIQSEEEIQVDSILMMLYSFENVLHPKSIQSKEAMLYPNLMLEIFTFINSGDNWKRSRREIALQLQSLDISNACFLATGKEDGDILSDVDEDKSAFYSRVIHLYTSLVISNNSDYDMKFYTALNLSMLTHGCKASFVTGEDLALAAYGALLNSILMYWGKLVPTIEPTYRGMILSEEAVDKYTVGQTITWLCFNSSSLNLSTAKIFGSVIFMIDNSRPTKYACKRIHMFSDSPGENEYLFPSGAKFRITKIKKTKDHTMIWINSEDY